MYKRNLKPANATGRTVIGYCRLSSTTQLQRSSDYSSLEAQAQQIREYCRREHPEWLPHLEIVHEVKSARDTNRPELQKILQRARQTELRAIVVVRLDRLARSVSDLLQMNALFEAHGVELISLKEAIDTTTAIGRLYRTLMAAFAEFERERIVERIRDKMHAMAEQGLWIRGRAPFGYRVDREHKRLIVDPEAAEWVRFIFQRFRETGCVGRVARELQNNHNFLAVRKARGYREVVRAEKLIENTLSNALYAGDLVYGGQVVAAGTHEAIVPRELFEMVQALLPNNREYRADYSCATQEDPYLLRGSIFCSECGGALTPYWVQGKSGIVHYYTHPRRSFCSYRWVNAKRVHQATWNAVGAIARLDAIAEQALLASETAETERTRREVQRLGEQIERLLLLHREGVEVPELSKQLALLQAQRAQLAAQVKVVDVEAVQRELEAFRAVLCAWNRTYETLSLQEQRELFALLVSRVEVAKEWARVYVPVSGRVRIIQPSGGAEGIRTPDL